MRRHHTQLSSDDKSLDERKKGRIYVLGVLRRKWFGIGKGSRKYAKEAIELVEMEVPLRKAADRIKVNYSTLYRYVKKKTALHICDLLQITQLIKLIATHFQRKY